MATMPLPSTTPTVSLKKFRKQICPHCGSKDIQRCRARGVIERHVGPRVPFLSALVCGLRSALLSSAAFLGFSGVGRAAIAYSKHVGSIEFLPDGDRSEVEKQLPSKCPKWLRRTLAWRSSARD
jgi:hypothetical protein